MLRITKIATLISFIMIGLGVSYAQEPDTAKTDDKTDIKVLEERVKNLQDEVDDNKADIKEELENKFIELNKRMYIYIGFVIAIIGFIGFFLNFFGKKTIRNWVDEKINEIAEEQLGERLEPIYLKYKDERTKELEEKWESRLKDIEKKWSDYDQTLKRAMSKIETDQGGLEITDISTKELNEFIDRLEKVKLENEYSALDWFIKAEIKKANGEYDEAISNFNKSIEMAPNEQYAYNGRGYCYLGMKRFKDAIEDFNRAIMLDARLAIAYGNRSRAYSLTNDYDNALRDINKAIELEPSNPIHFSNLATTLILLKNFEESLSNIDKAISLSMQYDSFLTILYYKKSIIQKILGKETKNSEMILNKLLEKDMNLEWFKLDSFIHILSKIDFSEDIRKFIQEKTEMLKKKIK